MTSYIFISIITFPKMLGYEILAQALAKQGVKNTYGIVGKFHFIQESQS